MVYHLLKLLLSCGRGGRRALGLSLSALLVTGIAAALTVPAHAVTEEEVEAAEKNAKQARAVLKQEVNALEDLNDELADVEGDIAKIENKLAGLNEDFAQAEGGKRERLAQRITKYTEELQGLQARRGTLQTQVAQAQARVATAQSSADQADRTAEMLDGQLEKAEEEAERAERMRKEAEEQRERAEREAAKRRRDAEEALDDAQEARDDAAEDVQDETEDVEAAALKVREAEAIVTQREQDLGAAQDERAQKKAQRALDKAKGYLARRQAEHAEEQQELQAAQAEFNAAEKAFLAARQEAIAAGVGSVQEQRATPVTQAQATRAQRPEPARAEPVRQPKPVLVPRRHVREESNSGPQPWTEAPEPQQPAELAGDTEIQTPPPQRAAIAEPGKPFQFDLPMVSGDREIVEKLDVWQEWSDKITFNPVTAEEINEFHGRLVKALQQEGYVFAKVVFPTRIWAYGIFLAKVDCGPLGTITVRGNRYYSARQVIKALRGEHGDRFNYARIHGDLFELNSRPDIFVDTRLRPVMQDGRRVINAELDVHDDLPIHGAIELSNTGTQQTNDWRIRTTLQHLNLSKQDDVLTVDWITSPDIGDVNAISGGYFLPIGETYSLNIYGGYSLSDIGDVTTDITEIRGEGYYAGGQITKTLRESARYRLQLSLGWLFQSSELEHEIFGVNQVERDVDFSMPSITLGYASRAFDKLGGRNYFSTTLMANFAGHLGSSEQEDYLEQGRAYAEGDFLINRFQIARLQRFFHGEDEPGKWTVFMKIEGQLASDTLVSQVTKSVGGANTVRGYHEQELYGDQVLIGNLELRTPLWHNFIPGLKKSEEFLEMNPKAWQRHRLQLVLFTDYAYVDIKNPVAGEQEDEAMFSAGAGVRLGLTRYSQMSLDYGYPFIESSDDTPEHGRAHLSLQLQF